MRRSLLIGPALGVVALAAGPTAALAASVGVDTVAGHLVYQAATGERNDVGVHATARGSDWRNITLTLRIIDSVPIVPGRGCTRPAPGKPTIVRCEYRQGSVSRPIFRLGDRSDSARFVTNTYLGSYLIGGPGNDELAGGRGTTCLQEARATTSCREPEARMSSTRTPPPTAATSSRRRGLGPRVASRWGSTTARGGTRCARISGGTVMMASAASGMDRCKRFSEAGGGMTT